MPVPSIDDRLRTAHAALARGHFADAERLCRAAPQAAPGRPDALALLGSVLMRSRRPLDAVNAFRAAADRQPAAAEHWNGLGVAQDAAGRPEEAVAALERATRLDPAQRKYLFNLGNALRQSRRHGEAGAAYGRAVDLDPGNAAYLSASLRERQQACRWDGIEADTARLYRLIEAGACVHPFRLAALGAPLALQRRNAEAWSARSLRREPAIAPPAAGPVPEPLVVGYLTGDLREHPVPTLMVDVLGAHDRRRVRVNVYSFGRDDGSEWRRAVDGAARRIAADGVHVLVDLMGWTRDSRPGILAHRPAPVQAGWLGYPGTLGSPALDFIIADPVVLPPADEPHYTERVIRLPGCYQPNSRRPTAPTPDRAAAGLPSDSFVFCCFKLSWKYDPGRFRLWTRLLSEVPDAVLRLLDGGADATANLRRETVAAGIDPARLVVAPRCPPAQHLARCRLADLFLDTLPYNGHTTPSDALWSGVPILTRPGDGFAGKVAASLLLAIGMPELIAADDEAKFAIARRGAGRTLGPARPACRALGAAQLRRPPLRRRTGGRLRRELRLAAV